MNPFSDDNNKNKPEGFSDAPQQQPPIVGEVKEEGQPNFANTRESEERSDEVVSADAVAETSPVTTQAAWNAHPTPTQQMTHGGVQASWYPQNGPHGVGAGQAPGYTTYTATTPPHHPQSTQNKRTSKIFRFLAAAVAVVLLSGISGYVGSSWQRRSVPGSYRQITPGQEIEAGEGIEPVQGIEPILGRPGISDDSSAVPAVKLPNSFADVVDNTQATVVEITTEQQESSPFMRQYTASGAGSGVIISADGYIATNNHVIAGADKITVTLKNTEEYDAELIGTDEVTDLAVLKINEQGLQAASFGDSDTLRVGDAVIAIGNPLGELGGTVTNGIISALDREITIDNQTMTLLQTNAAVNPGNSGGGLFNTDSKLIGIVNAKTASIGIEGLSFAIPLSTAIPVLEDLVKNRYVTGRIRLGVSFVDITTDLLAMQYRVDELGAYLYQVGDDSDAGRAGLKVGDLVHKIGDTKIYQSSEVKALMKDYSVGDTMHFTVKRDGKEMEFDVTFTEYKPQPKRSQ